MNFVLHTPQVSGLRSIHDEFRRPLPPDFNPGIAVVRVDKYRQGVCQVFRLLNRAVKWVSSGIPGVNISASCHFSLVVGACTFGGKF